MIRRAARRDANEPVIVEALRAAGASVEIRGESGEPDLMVGYRGVTYHLEVKLPLGPRGGNKSRGTGAARLSAGGDGTLSKDQIEWWIAWRGAPPVIVRTPDEALAAIGAADAWREWFAANVDADATAKRLIEDGRMPTSPTPITDMLVRAVTDRPDVLDVLTKNVKPRRSRK